MKPTTGYALPYSDDRGVFYMITLCAKWAPHSQALAD